MPGIDTDHLLVTGSKELLPIVQSSNQPPKKLLPKPPRPKLVLESRETMSCGSEQAHNKTLSHPRPPIPAGELFNMKRNLDDTFCVDNIAAQLHELRLGSEGDVDNSVSSSKASDDQDSATSWPMSKRNHLSIQDI